jgi:hypothetical protein
MDASAVSAYIAAAAAAVSAFSAWNSQRSAQASLASVKEARQQRAIDNSRANLAALGTVYDDSMSLVESLDRDLTRDPANVGRKREALRRSAFVAGIMTPAVQGLIEAAEPLPARKVEQLRRELVAISAALRSTEDQVLIDAATPDRQAAQ